MDEVQKTVWPCVNYRDARAAIEFLTEAFGFAYPLADGGGCDLSRRLALRAREVVGGGHQPREG